jgi:hypothetical protein
MMSLMNTLSSVALHIRHSCAKTVGKWAIFRAIAHNLHDFSSIAFQRMKKEVGFPLKSRRYGFLGFSEKSIYWSPVGASSNQPFEQQTGLRR